MKVLTKIFGFVVCCVVMFGLMLLLITPDKDKNGQYTQFIKYWTNTEYFLEKF